MKNKLKWIGHLTGSIIVALALFFNATLGNYQNKVEPSQASPTENYSHTLTYIPIEMDYDSSQYYISGFTSTVTVELSGSNRVLLQGETEEGTRSFKIRANLRNLEPGTHTVKLEAVNLPTGITANIDPSTITVQIGKIAKKDFAVKGVVKTEQVATGYQVDKVTVDTTSITITTDESTLARIDHIEAIIPDETALKADFSGTARLQAVDSKGNVLPVSLSSDETQMHVTIKKK
ncbi:CdaR family protein [Streptococcus sp. DD13]|uniref:CdaR family protein n=1 Tax=Streptococcus sp. DD13 TaxID=1777881 RepID=UPI000798289C|nr:CdaR family protein [Streptococcus sp. DD13]KXT79011.1 putative secreted protein associated with spyDAC [Streptococcus sp. DD13]